MKSVRFVGLLALSMLAPLGAVAGKKKEAPAEAPAAEAKVATEAPTDGASQKFLERLLEATVKNFSPSDGGAQFKYDELRFAPGNTFAAKGFVEMDGERMDCRETGSWKMDAAESEKVGTVEFTVAKTDCAGRDAGATVRLRMTIDKGSVSTEFR